MPWITWRHACLYTLIYICIQLLSNYSACFYPATSFGKHCPAICIYPACPIFKHASKRELLPQYICPEKVFFYGILSQLWKFLFFRCLLLAVLASTIHFPPSILSLTTSLHLFWWHLKQFFAVLDTIEPFDKEKLQYLGIDYLDFLSFLFNFSNTLSILWVMLWNE